MEATTEFHKKVSIEQSSFYIERDTSYTLHVM